jgi:hypothetical protein
VCGIFRACRHGRGAKALAAPSFGSILRCLCFIVSHRCLWPTPSLQPSTRSFSLFLLRPNRQVRCSQARLLFWTVFHARADAAASTARPCREHRRVPHF